MKKEIAIIPGDGIGPEVTRQSVKVLDAVAERFGHRFDYTYGLLGADALEKTGNPLPDETLEICADNDAVLLGAVGHPHYDNNPSTKLRPEQGLLRLRKSLGLFANIRPVTTFDSLHHLSPLKSSQLAGVDFVIYRELTGGIYFGEKELNADGTEASDLCIYSQLEIERIAHLAFKAAQSRRKKLTLVDKANVLETSRLWRKVVEKLAVSYPDVRVDYMFVDNAAMQIILNPRQFDVVLTENMFGDILSDEASVITGSLGMMPSASVGGHTSLFEPVHGSYPEATGKDIANPIGSILSAAMMLDYFKLSDEAECVRKAVAWTLNFKFVTRDLDPLNYYFTSTIGDLVSDFINGRVSQGVNETNIELRKSTII